MRRANVSFRLYRTRIGSGPDAGKLHPRWRFRYVGADGKLKAGTGFTDKQETARLAQQLAMEADEIRRGIRQPPHPAATESLRPVEEHIQEYRQWGEAQGGRGGRPWSTVHRRNVKNVLEWMARTLQWKTLRDVDLPSVEKTLREMKRGKRKAEGQLWGKTLSNYARMFKAFTRWCVQRKCLVSDPLGGLSRFDTSVKEPKRPLSVEDLGKLLAAAPPERARVYGMAVLTGFRASELASLRAGDLATAKSAVFLHAEHAKDRRDAVCAIPADLCAELAKLHEGSAETDLLLPGFPFSHPARVFDKDCTAAGIPKRSFRGKVDFHALRTTHVQLGVETFDGKTAMTLARHKDPWITMNVYAKANPDRLRAAVETLGQVVAEAAEKARSEQTGVKREALRLAAGAENLSQPFDAPEAAQDREMVRAVGIEPTPNAGPVSEKNPPVSENIREPSTPGTSAAVSLEPGKPENASPEPENGNPTNRRQTAVESELERVIRAWPDLPEPIRKAIRVLIESAQPPR